MHDSSVGPRSGQVHPCHPPGQPAGSLRFCAAPSSAPSTALAPAWPLPPLTTCRESAVAAIYERVAPAVANVYDITLRTLPVGGAQAVEQPEGNGTGFVWDAGKGGDGACLPGC